MERLRITEARLHAFTRQLEEEERSCATVEKYMRSIRQFVQWLNGQPVTKAAVGSVGRPLPRSTPSSRRWIGF